MGNEASRCSGSVGRFARFTRIQSFSGQTSKATHLKTNSFQTLVPDGQTQPADTNRGAEAPVCALLTPEQTQADAIASAIGDAAGDDQLQTEMNRSEGAADESTTDLSKQSTNILSTAGTAGGSMALGLSEGDAGNGMSTHASEGSERPKRNSNHRHVEDGETKKMNRGGSQGGHGRASGGSQRGTGMRSGSFANGNPATARSEKLMSKDGGACGSAPAHGTPFPKRPMACKLNKDTWAKLEVLFRLMDQDGSNAVSREEARAFFKGAFSNLSADAMFNEVDVDGSGAITSEEFVKFWLQVRASGYKEQDIMDEVSELIEGGTWVDWKDGRDTCPAQVAQFPKRPMLCRLTKQTWSKCEELFYKISGSDKEMTITREQAQKFFKGAFALISADAMFNEIDLKHHGIITAKDFMNFWVQVKYSGYKEKDILDEIECIMDGNPWVDWKDGRKT